MNIQDTFDDSIRRSTLPDAVTDIAELGVDSLIDNELMKQIPVVKTFVGIIQAGVNIHDKLFLKKILSFLQDIDSIDAKERERIIASIDASKKYRIKVGEKLLYIIDSCDDYESAQLVAKLFKAVLTESITYDDYIEAASIIVRLSNRELELFIKTYKLWYMEDDAKELTHTGLVYSEVDEVTVDVEKEDSSEPDEPSERYEANVSGGEVQIMPTSAGNTIYEVFGIGKEALQKRLDAEREERRAKYKI